MLAYFDQEILMLRRLARSSDRRCISRVGVKPRSEQAPMFEQPRTDTQRRSYQEMTFVIMYQRPTSPAATNTNIPTFSQKWPSLKAVFLLIFSSSPPYYEVLPFGAAPKSDPRDNLHFFGALWQSWTVLI